MTILEFHPPGVVSVEMTGADTQHLDPDGTAHRLLRARAGSVPGFIAGTGEFRIKAKWHTDPADLANFGGHSRLRSTAPPERHQGGR